MSKEKQRIVKGYVYKPDIDNCISVLLFYQNVEAGQEILLASSFAPNLNS